MSTCVYIKKDFVIDCNVAPYMYLKGLISKMRFNPHNLINFNRLLMYVYLLEKTGLLPEVDKLDFNHRVYFCFFMINWRLCYLCVNCVYLHHLLHLRYLFAIIAKQHLIICHKSSFCAHENRAIVHLLNVNIYNSFQFFQKKSTKQIHAYLRTAYICAVNLMSLLT